MKEQWERENRGGGGEGRVGGRTEDEEVKERWERENRRRRW